RWGRTVRDSPPDLEAVKAAERKQKEEAAERARQRTSARFAEAPAWPWPREFETMLVNPTYLFFVI
ncbi:hypothetical protein CRG98_037965, partial [Punica granatum]